MESAGEVPNPGTLGIDRIGPVYMSLFFRRSLGVSESSHDQNGNNSKINYGVTKTINYHIPKREADRKPRQLAQARVQAQVPYYIARTAKYFVHTA